MFDRITQLTAWHAQVLEQAVKEFYNEHEIDLNRLVMLTSDGASVMLGRWNGLAALLKRNVVFLVFQNSTASHIEKPGTICFMERQQFIEKN